MAWHAGIIALVGALLIFAITKWLFNSTNQTEAIETVAPKIYGMRKKYFLLLMSVIVIALIASLRGLPYFPPEGESPDYTITVQGQMFGWVLGDIRSTADQSTIETIPAGKLVEFMVSSQDVNHGFGVYNHQGEILTQVQVMPGYQAKLYYRFKHPGTYHIICMEYCGAGHPFMNQTFNVL